MTNKKKSTNNLKKPILNEQSKHHKKLVIIFSVITVILIAFFAVKIRDGLQQQQILESMDAVSRDAKVIYNQLVLKSGDNVKSHEFNRSCGESSVKYGRGTITCSIYGGIELKTVVNPEVVVELLDSIGTVGRLVPEGATDVFDGSDRSSVESNYLSGDDKIMCSVYYSTGKPRDGARFLVGCRRVVPDFLPGYPIR